MTQYPKAMTLFIFVVLISLSGCGTLNPKTPVTINDQALQPRTIVTTPKQPPSSKPSSGPRLSQAATSPQSEKPRPQAGLKAPVIEFDELPDSNIRSTELDEALEFVQVAQDFWQHGELDNALEALDQAYALVLGVDIIEQPELMQQKEDLRIVISRRILEIYASRHIVVNGTHNAIPLVLNDHVQYEINLLTTGAEKDFFRRAYQRSGRYRPYILGELEAAGLPLELSWLPLIESGFMVNALSPARALGLWQFIPSTGYKFGLTRDEFVDERLDPYKATRAAIEYMTELHNMFGDWSTVLASYNCGENRVLRLIREQNINYLDDFWDLYQRLPRETARYVPRFLATLHIVSDPAAYGLDDIELDDPLTFDVVTTNRQIHLRDLAQAMDVPETTLKRLNPELRRNIVPAQSYALRIPEGETDRFQAVIDNLATSRTTVAAATPTPGRTATAADRTVHTIRRGETLSTIASRYGITTTQLARHNNLSSQHRILAGAALRIPGSPTTSSRAETGRSASAQPSIINYTVSRGDSLWILAQRHQTTTRRIQDLNRLSGTTLQVGQTLRIPVGEASSPSTPTRTYQVRQGDSPYIIAQRHRMPLDRFLALNQLSPRCHIYPGQTVYVE